MGLHISLIGTELEENLALRYIASSLEAVGHSTSIVAFSTPQDADRVLRTIVTQNPDICGLSMIFTSRAQEFLELAKSLRKFGYQGHIIAGGHFASFNFEKILTDVSAIDSVALGEGEHTMVSLAKNLHQLERVDGLCYRDRQGRVFRNDEAPSQDLDELPFPKRLSFHDYFGHPIASMLSSRGCWRSCHFCSINAWYRRCGGKRFRIRSVENIADEMTLLYHEHGIRIFNFQDDNFFLPRKDTSAARFEHLRDLLRKNGVTRTAIAIKARPDSITHETVAPLDDLGLFRVFLGVENGSQRGLDNLNRKSTLSEIEHSLKVLNDFDIHVAYNLLMFEPNTTMDDIHGNLRFMERHIDNPFNFCRAEAYAGTGLETILQNENALLGDWLGFDYRLKHSECETFHQIANFAFFDRNFNNNGLHYFNMQVDFYYQILRRFFPTTLDESIRSDVKNFIKCTNLDTYAHLCRIYDFVQQHGSQDRVLVQGFASEMRYRVDESGRNLLVRGCQIINDLEKRPHREHPASAATIAQSTTSVLESLLNCSPAPYDERLAFRMQQFSPTFGMRLSLQTPIPYHQYKGWSD
ncbi:MAG: B12-binding domain-containing radical SAM protein [Deltaproteobacteria bacterium]|nr:B12-binding domain-containing radical SAM protein [Deltaproteobacteria bacterium]